ncbi:hypothetical protein BHE74_00004595, partial [Ensete ventricosum]
PLALESPLPHPFFMPSSGTCGLIFAILCCRDLSNNNIGGGIPENLPLTLHILNIENNLFSGPVPEKLLNIPNFK